MFYIQVFHIASVKCHRDDYTYLNINVKNMTCFRQNKKKTVKSQKITGRAKFQNMKGGENSVFL